MTDQQLALLLQSYAQRLRAELVALSDRLPAELEREMEWWDKEKNCRGPEWAGFDDFIYAGGKYEQRPTGAPVVLDDLWKFVQEFEEATMMLSGQNSVSVLEPSDD